MRLRMVLYFMYSVSKKNIFPPKYLEKYGRLKIRMRQVLFFILKDDK